jgi:hypothetical protein
LGLRDWRSWLVRNCENGGVQGQSDRENCEDVHWIWTGV